MQAIPGNYTARILAFIFRSVRSNAVELIVTSGEICHPRMAEQSLFKHSRDSRDRLTAVVDRVCAALSRPLP